MPFSLRVASALLFAACGRLDFAAQPQPLPPPTELTVEPQYAMGAEWNAYVGPSGAPCTEAGNVYYSACVHGGDKRRAVLTDRTSCAGITASDSAGALHWICKEVPSGIELASTGLDHDHRLADLLTDDGAAWRELSLTVRDGSRAIAASAPGAWWHNPIAALPEGEPMVTLDAPGTVYTVRSSTQRGLILVTADGVAITTLGDAVLSLDTSLADNCVRGIGNSDLCMITAPNRRFLWIEGSFAAPDRLRGSALVLYGAQFVRLRRIRADQLANAMELDQNTRSVLISDLRTRGGGNTTVRIGEFSSHIILADMLTVGDGFTAQGLDTNKSEAAIISRVTAAFHDGVGVADSQSGSGSTWLHVLGTDSGDGPYGNAGGGLYSQFGVTALRIGSTYVDVVSLNSAGAGFTFFNLSGARGVDLIQGDPAGAMIDAHDSMGIELGGLLGFSAAVPTCIATNTDGIDASCASGGTNITGLDLTSALVGYVDDVTNASAVNGARAYDEITDWSHFDSPWRVWAPPARGVGHTKSCRPGDTCRVFDLRPAARADNPLYNRSGTLVAPNEPFVPGATCPSATDGDLSVMDTNGNLFLRHAYEALDDGSGDDDGLCESGEACIYAPNSGAYQGEGELVGPCAFHDGAVSGVAMYAWSQNGG